MCKLVIIRRITAVSAQYDSVMDSLSHRSLDPIRKMYVLVICLGPKTVAAQALYKGSLTYKPLVTSPDTLELLLLYIDWVKSSLTVTKHLIHFKFVLLL